MKKLISFFVAVLVMATPVFAQEFVAVRATAEEQGWSVDWDATNRIAFLTSPYGVQYFIGLEGTGSFIEDGRMFSPESLVDLIMFVGTHARLVGGDGDIIHGQLTRIGYGDNVAYIFGTMHAAQPHWFPLHPMAEEAMQNSDVFVFEVDMNELAGLATNPLLAAQVAELQMLPDGLTLEDVLPEDIFNEFITSLETFAPLGINYETLQHFTPIAISMLLENVMTSLLGVDFSLSVDDYIASFANANGKPVLGLNTILNEFDIIYNVPLEIQATAMAGFPTFEEMFIATSDVGIIEAYANQDLDAIRTMFSIPEDAELSEYTEMFMHNLFYVRCHIFANEIARLLQETEEPTTFFVAIGIGHIIGGCCNEGGGIVLYLLNEKGFELEPLWQN